MKDAATRASVEMQECPSNFYLRAIQAETEAEAEA